MNEIHYTSVKDYIKDLCKEKNRKSFAPVYLIYGEELLYKTVLENLTSEMLPASQRKLNYDAIEGTHENIPVALERINTFSLLSDTKVVALLDAKIFYSKQNEAVRLEKAKEAYDQQDMKKAANYFLGVLAGMQLSLDDLQKTSTLNMLALKSGNETDHSWIEHLMVHCKENSHTFSPEQDYVHILESAIEKGFPKSNHLIITTEIMDKRRRLYQIIKEKGVAIDCSVPKGERRADKDAQEAVLAERLKAMLSQFKKRISREASATLFEMTGFDLRTFSNNVEKLIHYVGDREEIDIEDIASVLERTKQDPIYELTNAVSDRNAGSALFFLHSLLSEDTHPLQALAAITNTLRKLLAVKAFIDSPAGKVWRADCYYNRFQKEVMPVVQAFDRQSAEQLTEWENSWRLAKKEPDEKTKTVSKSKKPQYGSDLIIAKNTNNPYPIFQTFKKADKYTQSDLIQAIQCLADADRRIKSTGQDPKLILENTILHICGIGEIG